MKTKNVKNIFLSSIYQDAGKTTVSLGLYKVFQEAGLKVAFIKPVGQRYVNVGDMHIDKDSYLIGEVYRCAKEFKYMSPVTIGRGFTEKYIMNPQKDSLEKKITTSFQKMVKGKDAIIVEGTGHAGVGSVIDLSNADVARLVGSKVIIVSEGGIGKSIDEIMLNKALFDLNNVEVLGVIINKVIMDKYEKIQRVLSQGLANKGLKLLGVIPARPLLSCPTVEQVKDSLNIKVLAGEKHLSRRVKNVIVAAMEPHNMVNYLEDGTLVLASGDRIDNILLAVSSHLVRDGRRFQLSGIILTGGLMPNDQILDLLNKSKLSILITQEDTFTVAAKVENLKVKIQKTDVDKIEEATRLVKKYVDVKTILNSFNE